MYRKGAGANERSRSSGVGLQLVQSKRTLTSSSIIVVVDGGGGSRVAAIRQNRSV